MLDTNTEKDTVHSTSSGFKLKLRECDIETETVQEVIREMDNKSFENTSSDITFYTRLGQEYCSHFEKEKNLKRFYVDLRSLCHLFFLFLFFFLFLKEISQHKL